MQETVTLEIDGIEINVPKGTSILNAARQEGINIPTLCHHEDLGVAGNCRLCVVEVEGQRNLCASCAYNVDTPLKVKTISPRIRHARKDILDLLIADHCGDCYTCSRDKNCELQTLAAEYGVDTLRFRAPDTELKPKYEIDRSNPSIVRDMNKCIMCGRCVRTCRELQGVSVLSVSGRGSDTQVTTIMDKPLNDVRCITCGQCINHCPTGAISELDARKAVWAAIDDPKKHVVIQTAPSPRAAIGETAGLEPGTPLTFEMNSALKAIGFDRVFDTNFTADLTIIEEGTELLLRLYKALVEKDESIALPQFTSCCPGWVKMAEDNYPENIPNVSSAKSPQQMFGSVIKTYYSQVHGIAPEDIVTISLMPCTAKKFECERPEMTDSGLVDVDYVLTTRELGKMFKEAGVDLLKMPKTEFDEPFGPRTGSGVIFGASGGVMEAALRTVIELVMGKKAEELFDNANITPVRGFEGVKYAEVTIDEVGDVPGILAHLVPNWDWLKGATLKLAICHGGANIDKVMEDIKNGGKLSECHFIEFMACPGGCLGGGGQPMPTNAEVRAARSKAIYAEDIDSDVRKSHENPAVLEVYEKFFTEGPCGHKSHKLLHTGYTDRKAK
ncbi:MAG: 2Fe-2S iron-sulfur cluster binding domain-containing protein [Alphaproteobacteria bacterium]|nr:2Fe-2S iron-sulfur cluster binding domain-containing protein [Alphaproteobacteria bacterium]